MMKYFGKNVFKISSCLHVSHRMSGQICGQNPNLPCHFGQTLKEFESFLHFLLNFFIICYYLYLFIKLKHFENFRKDILMNFLENS